MCEHIRYLLIPAKYIFAIFVYMYVCNNNSFRRDDVRRWEGTGGFVGKRDGNNVEAVIVYEALYLRKIKMKCEVPLEIKIT